jgi:hypothetical protein
VKITNELNDSVKLLRARKNKDQNLKMLLFKLMPTFIGGPFIQIFSYLSSIGLKITAIGLKRFEFGSCIVTSLGKLDIDNSFAPIPPLSFAPILLTLCSKYDVNKIDEKGNILTKSYLEIIDNIDSHILENNNNYKQYLIQWLAKPNQNFKNLNNIRLLYRGSRDGFKAQNFHDRCNNKGETLVIIKSDADYIFGGYTEINWDNTKWNGKVGEQNNARRQGNGNEFVFTLKNPHNISPSKFNMKNEWLNHSICCDVNLGPIFGCNDIRVENDCNIKKNRFTFYDFQRGEYCFDDTTGKKRLLFTGTETYTIKEIEVFNIIR